MAAELGTMRVTEQIDALRTLATHPVDYLVVPRVFATIIAMPLLTIESVTVGIFSGYLVGVHLLNIDATYAVANMVKYSDPPELWMGIIKGTVFGGIIATISSYKGLNCPQGAEGVGKATTEAVVAASISILITNFFLTLFLTKALYR
jgi:phospholipid/cholesterol/gamma-HCH transport system permease protein